MAGALRQAGAGAPPAALAVLAVLLTATSFAVAQDCDELEDEASCTDMLCDWLMGSCTSPSYGSGGSWCESNLDCNTPEICDASVSSCYDPNAGGDGGGDLESGGGGTDVSCPAGQYYGETYYGVDLSQTAVGCIACPAGQYYGGGQDQSCIDCVANTYVDVTGSDEASDCIACPNNGVTRSRVRDPDGHMAGQINAAGTPSVDGCSGCEDGTSYRTTTHSCTMCPFPNRCVAGHCTEGSQGDGCASCQTTSPRYYALGQLCQQCPDSTPWLFIFGSVFMAAGIIILLYKVAEVHENVMEDAEAAKDALSDAKSVVAAGRTIYRNHRAISIYISISMPHFQLLSVLVDLDLGWPDVIKKAARVVADFLSFDFGSATTPECVVQTEDPQALFLYKFAATHCAFATIVVLLLVAAGIQAKRSSVDSFRKMLNTINAVLTLSVVSLTKSALRAIDCTYDSDVTLASITADRCGDYRTEAACDYINCAWESDDTDWGGMCYIVGEPGPGGVVVTGNNDPGRVYASQHSGWTLDAMPDVECAGTSFLRQQYVAAGLILLYNLIIPAVLFNGLRAAKASGRIDDPDYLQGHGWFLGKYRSGAWYSEFVFLYYKIAMASFSVLLGSSARAAVCMGLMGLLTAALLAFVLFVRPFKDDRSIVSASTEAMTAADKMQASAFVATIAACAIGFLCALTKDRGAVLNTVLALLTALISVIPIAVGFYLDPPCKEVDKKQNDDEQQENPAAIS